MVVDISRGWWLQVLGQRCAAGSSVASTNWTCGAQRSNDRRRPRGWLLRFLRRRTRPAAVVLLPAHAATATAADTAALAVDVRRVRDDTSQQSTTPRIALHVTDMGVSRLPTGMRRRTHKPTTRRPTTPTECRRRRTATRTCSRSRSHSSTRWCLAAGATAVDPTVQALVGAETVAQANLLTTTRRQRRVWARRTWAMVEQTVATVGDGVLVAVRSPRRTCAHADGDPTLHR